MADPAFMKLTFEEKDIAVLTLDDPRGSANVLSQAVISELEQHLNDLEGRKDLAGLVIRSGKPGVFIVGADNKVTFQPVRIGIAGEDYFEVLSGLQGGETIVSGSYQAIRDLKEGTLVRESKQTEQKGVGT